MLNTVDNGIQKISEIYIKDGILKNILFTILNYALSMEDFHASSRQRFTLPWNHMQEGFDEENNINLQTVNIFTQKFFNTAFDKI